MSRATVQPRCSICRAEIQGDGLTLIEIGSSPISVGLYCRPRCRDAAQAVAALNDLPPFTPRALIEQRREIAEALLALWRRRVGPDPLLVIAAAERASAPDPALAPVGVSRPS